MGIEEFRKIKPMPIIHKTNIHVFIEYTAPRQVPSLKLRIRLMPRLADLSRMKWDLRLPARIAPPAIGNCHALKWLSRSAPLVSNMIPIPVQRTADNKRWVCLLTPGLNRDRPFSILNSPCSIHKKGGPLVWYLLGKSSQSQNRTSPSPN